MSKLLFWVKQKYIHLDCFTSNESIAKIYPIDKASSYVPTWWKSLPSEISMPHEKTGKPRPYPTMAGCAGFIDYYRYGITVPLWCDMELFFDGNSYAYHHTLTSETRIDKHNSIQWGNRYPDFQHFKFISPWVIKEKTGVNFLLTGCTWSLMENTPNVQVLPGILAFNIQTTLNINLFIKNSNDNKIFFPGGMPIAYFSPLSDKKVKIHTHVVTEPEMKKITTNSTGLHFIKSYLKRKKIVDNRE